MLFLSLNMKAQTSASTGLGIGAGVCAAGFIVAYPILNKRDYKQKYTQPIHDPAAAKRSVQRGNLPYLLIGAGCGVLSIASFLDGAVISKKNKSKSLTIAARGNTIGIAFNF